MSKCRTFEILDGQLDGSPALSSLLVNSKVYQIEQTGAFYPIAHQDSVKMTRLAESIHTLFGFQGIRVPFDLCYENNLPLYAGCTAPFTLGGYLREAEEFLPLTIQDPDRLKALLDWLVVLVGDYANKLLDAGANVIVLIDPSASANMISPRIFERFILPVYDRLKKVIRCGRLTKIIWFRPRKIILKRNPKGGFYDAKRDHAKSF